MTSLFAQLDDSFFQERTGTDCVGDNGFCPDWIADNIGEYFGPLGNHVILTIVPVSVGILISFALAVAAHKNRSLTGPFSAVTGTLYTVPSIAAYLLLIPITGFGTFTAFVVLTAYTLLILFRNMTTGLRNVPAEAIDAARGMGMTDNQILRSVELPLATPEILAGVRIAFTTTVGLAAFAFLCGAPGLGQQIFTEKAGTGGLFFKSNVVVAGGLCVLLAAAGDLVILAIQRLALPWRRVGAR